MKVTSLFAGALLALLALPTLVQAQDAPPSRIRGVIEAFSDNKVTVKTREGDEVTVALTDKTGVTSTKRQKVTDIKEGKFIGTAAIEGKDGKLHAEEVLIFPEGMRMGEGHYPWDLTPGDSMTNADVATVTKVKKVGQVLTLKHKDGENEVIVDRKTPIVTFEKVADNGKALKKGRHVFIVAKKGADGAEAALFVVVEKNKVRPPM